MTPGPGPERIVATAAGDHHSAAIDADGRLWTTGANFRRRQGGPWTPAPIPGPVAAVTYGCDGAAALTTEGEVWMCGSNISGQHGHIGAAHHDSRLPWTRSPLPVGAVAVACGDTHTLAVDTNRKLWGCGHSFHGALADRFGQRQWTKIATRSPIVDVAAGANHTVLLDADGVVWGCGDNRWGQLGSTGCYDYSDGTTPVLRPLSDEIVGARIAVGYATTAIVDTGGHLHVAGVPRDQCGPGSHITVTQRSTWRRSAFDSAVVDGAIATDQPVAVTADGTVWANTPSRHTDGDRFDISGYWHPIPVDTHAVAASIGINHGTIVDRDGRLWLWGASLHGQLGFYGRGARIPFALPTGATYDVFMTLSADPNKSLEPAEIAALATDINT